jgi:alpha-L-rhamnosidase
MRVTVLVPAKNADAITESGKPLAKAPGVKFLRMEGDRAVLEVEAGSYRFASRIAADEDGSLCLHRFCSGG